MSALSRRVLNTTRPFGDRAQWIRMAPGAVLAVIALGSLWLILPAERRAALAIATVLTVAIYAAMLLPWHRWSDPWQAVLPIAGFLPVAAFDYAAGMFYLAVMPVIWVGLFSTRWVMLVTLACYLVTVFAPRIIVPDAYPSPDMTTLLITSVLVIAGGLAEQSLMSGAREAMAEVQAATAQARADRDMLDAYLDNIGALVVILDPKGRILLFNRWMEEATGARTADVVGHVTWDADDADEEERQTFERVLAGECPISNESDLHTAQGETKRICWNTTALTDGAGKVTRVISVGVDVTAERAAEAATREALERERQATERLRELDAVKNDFVATVSHDLRTPLTSIIGNTELLLDGDAGRLEPLQRRLMGAVDRNARRLDTLVGDLLLLSRVESGTMRLNLAPVAVRDVVDGAVEAISGRWSSDVQLAVHLPDRPVLVSGDLDQLERVTTNLLSNALKFTPPGGQVEVEVDADPERARLQVSDTGIGIPEEELPQIFDRFYRTTRSQQQGKPGTGLGLAIVKSIVELHHGTIDASANPAGGTTFTITLPRLVEAELPAAEQ